VELFWETKYIDDVRIDLKKIIHIYQFLIPLIMEILWMRMDEKGFKNTTKVDPPQRIDKIKFEKEVGI
jgi:hypothetical protein